MKRFAIPKHRVIDAAPIAGICILIPFAYPIAFALLHVWLWLRHPRSKSRYTIAAAIALLFCATTLGLAALIAWTATSVSRDADLLRKVTPAFFGAVTAGGIVPILYRLFSRNSLRFKREKADDQTESQARGSIADILFLSLFAAVSLISLKTIQSDMYFGRAESLIRIAPTQFDPLIAFAASVAAVICMRLTTKSSKLALLGVAVFCYLMSGAILYIALEAGTVLEWYNSNPDEELMFAVQDYRIVSVLRTAFLSAIPLPVFALLMRGCGVGLESQQVAAKPQGFMTKSARLVVSLIGFSCVVFVVGYVCFFPGERAAGIPLTYSHSINPKLLLWKQPVSSYLALSVDFFVWLSVIIVAVPKLLASLFSERTAKFCRTIVIGGFAAIVVYAVYWYPIGLSRLAQSEGIVGVSRAQQDDCAVVSVIQDIENSFGWNPEFRRSQIRGATLEKAAPSVVRRVLALPRLTELDFDDCEIRAADIAPQQGSRFLSELTIKNCVIEPGAAKILMALPSVSSIETDVTSINSLSQHPILSEYIAQGDFDFDLYVNENGVIELPPNLLDAELYFPDTESRDLEIRGADSLVRLEPRNTVGQVPQHVSKLTIRNLPALQTLDIDVCQKFDLTIANTPELTSIEDCETYTRMHPAIYGEQTAKTTAFSRVTGFRVSAAPKLQRIRLDVSECNDAAFSIQGSLANNPLTHLEIDGRTYESEHAGGRLAAEKISKMLSQFPNGKSIQRVQIFGSSIDQSVAQQLSRLKVESLSLLDCDILSSSIDASAFPGIKSLVAVGYAPNDQQFAGLIDNAPALKVLHINGSNLTKIPESFAPKGGDISLVGGSKIKSLSSQLIQNAAVLCTMDTKAVRSAAVDRTEYDDLDVVFWLQGESANSATVANIVKRATSKGAAGALRVCLVAPTADSKDFANADWGVTQSLSVIDARIDDATVASWKMPFVEHVDVSKCDVTAATLLDLSQRGLPSLGLLRMREIEFKTPIKLPVSKTTCSGFDFAGSKLTKRDLLSIFRSGVDWVNLEDTGFTRKEINVIKESVPRSPDVYMFRVGNWWQSR